MIAVDVRTRSVKAGEHLQLLRSLASELERAMDAMSRNDLQELEDSVANQQELSQQLGQLADELSSSAQSSHPIPPQSNDTDLMGEIRTATGELQRLNFRYSVLLQHSSRSVALMASLFTSFKGQLQEASGPRLKHQTWSCRV
jgi:predicted DNA-binding transcriptional regulator YafY